MKKVGKLVAALAVGLGSLGVVAPDAHAATQTCTWTGAGADAKFSTAANWSNCNSSVPQTGDIIVLAYTVTADSSAPVALTNDLPSTTHLGGLTIDSRKAGTTTNENTLYAVDQLDFADAAAINVVSGGSVVVNDKVVFAGSVTFTNASPDLFSAPTAGKVMTATDVVINNPTLTENCSGGFGGGGYAHSLKPTGQVTVGQRTFYSIAGTESSIVVAPTGLISLQSGTYNGNITFNGGGSNQAPECGVASAYSMMAYTNTVLGGTITLNGGDIAYNILAGYTVTLTGTINGNGSAIVAYSGSTGSLINNAVTNNSSTPGGLQAAVPMKTLPAITDSQPTADLAVNANTTVPFDGVRDWGSVAAKGVLMGNGTFMSGLSIEQSGIVAPGHSPGCLTSDTLRLYGTYQFELGGTDPCTGYDQLIVKNAGASTEAITLGADSVLSTARYNNYTPKQGQTFVIINQEGSAAVAGTFKNLPEGATFEQNGIVFKISYKGGDGNDVVLTVMNSPVAPDTGVAILKSSPAIIAVGAAVLALALVRIARTAKQRR